ncbi:MAG TPA: hypothetical protein VFI88_05090 [Sphingomicrobium sp.]|jgi:hypothetical protein|nr:hypothetical protein [Sphingomicrobium sp.]
MKKLLYSAVAASFVLSSSVAVAGEIKGPPPESNLPPHQGPISNGKSLCDFSGLNETPEGLFPEDPGGMVQSYGYFMSHFDAFDPSDPAERAGPTFPGTSCNAHENPNPFHD